jgi:ribonuclease J
MNQYKSQPAREKKTGGLDTKTKRPGRKGAQHSFMTSPLGGQKTSVFKSGPAKNTSPDRQRKKQSSDSIAQSSKSSKSSRPAARQSSHQKLPSKPNRSVKHDSNRQTSLPYGTVSQVLPTDTQIYALGGLGEVGKNMYCYEQGNEIVIVDCGVLFPGDDLLGVDYVIPDYHHLIKNNSKRKILVITHGHEDHIGGIPFLLKQVNIDTIYAPRFAKALIEKKLAEHKDAPKVKIIEIDEDSAVKTKYFNIGFFNTIHSIPDSLGVMLSTPNGTIVHTGDFKFDLTPVGQNADYQKMAYIGALQPDLLMSDSTNSGVEGFSISEKEVAGEILRIMKSADHRIIIATFASNVYRVAQIIDAAVSTGRKVAVFGRSMENVVDIGRRMGVIHVKDSELLSPDELRRTPDEKVCILCTGSQGEPLAALSRIVNGTHRYIHLKPTDTVVFSSNPIPGNDASVNKIIDKLFRSGATVLNKSVLNNLHTTGHASKQEQKLMMQLIKPKYFMPIHGEHKMLMQHRQSAIELGIPPENIFICANGDVLLLRDHQVLSSNWRYQGDDIYVDGNDISGLSTAVLKDRRILADNGLVAVVVAIDSKENKILSRPVIVSRGFVFLKDSQALIKEAEFIVSNALSEKMKERTTFAEIKNCIRSSLEPFLYKKTKRNPVVIPVILNSKKTMEELAAKNASRARKTSSAAHKAAAEK